VTAEFEKPKLSSSILHSCCLQHASPLLQFLPLARQGESSLSIPSHDSADSNSDVPWPGIEDITSVWVSSLTDGLNLNSHPSSAMDQHQRQMRDRMVSSLPLYFRNSLTQFVTQWLRVHDCRSVGRQLCLCQWVRGQI